METAYSPAVMNARALQVTCRECTATRPLFEWALEVGFIAPMPAPGQPVRREDETLQSPECSNVVCPRCGYGNLVQVHRQAEVLSLIMVLPPEALSQIFAKRMEKRASDKFRVAQAA